MSVIQARRNLIAAVIVVGDGAGALVNADVRSIDDAAYALVDALQDRDDQQADDSGNDCRTCERADFNGSHCDVTHTSPEHDFIQGRGVERWGFVKPGSDDCPGWSAMVKINTSDLETQNCPMCSWWDDCKERGTANCGGWIHKDKPPEH